jgi:hypothetical protein
MNYLHYEFDLGPNDIVRISLDKQANVRLLDESNYQNYRAGKQHRFNGGLAKRSPIDLKAPHQGHWHLVIDLGGFSGTIHASTQVLKR